MVKQQSRNKKGERDVQGCDVDQSRGDAQGVKEKEEKRGENTRRNGACVRPRVCSHKSSEVCKKKD